MAKITKVQSGTTHSYKMTLPKELAENFIEKHGNEISIKPHEDGFKIEPVNTINNNDKLIARELQRIIKRIARVNDISEAKAKCYIRNYVSEKCNFCNHKEVCKAIYESEV